MRHGEIRAIIKNLRLFSGRRGERMKFYIIDAFTDKIFGGNPAGVVILHPNAEFPQDEIMLKTAAELRYSETAFIKQKSGSEFQIRYFTPTEEVDLCGHATIASFCALLDAGLISDNGTYRNETLAGILNIKAEKGFILMDMAAPEALGAIEEKDALKELYVVLGLDPEQSLIALDDEWRLFPEKISTGLPDIMLPVADRNALMQIDPDFPALSRLSEKHGVVGVHAFTLGEGLTSDKCHEEGQITAYCRNFAPLVGIDEEAATGTSNGALTYYLYKNNLIDEGADCIFLQGEAMGRPSKIMSKVTMENGNVKIQIGGIGAILAKGEIDLFG